METLEGYAQKTDHIMGATGLSIAKRANELKKSTCLGGVETAIDEPAKKLRRRDTNRGGDAARRDDCSQELLFFLVSEFLLAGISWEICRMSLSSSSDKPGRAFIFYEPEGALGNFLTIHDMGL